MKIALVHDWLITPGGAEKVLFELLKLFPSPVHTLLYKKDNFPSLNQEEIHTSFLQKCPKFLDFHRFLLPLFPLAVRGLNLSSVDVILSSSHAVAKAVRKREQQIHICYCHTPMRYAWDLQKEYVASLPTSLQFFARIFLNRLREWDRQTASYIDFFIANSHYVANRIRKHYQKESKVIYPPVDVQRFFLSSHREEYYVTHARLVSYKKIDLLIETFNKMPDKQLMIIGEGPEEKKLKNLAKQNTSFLGYVSDDQLPKILSQAKAYLFAADEDFGISVVEAQSSGLPIIALRTGGVLETVIEGQTGLFFDSPTPSSCMEAIRQLDKIIDQLDPVAIRQHASSFDIPRFHQQIKTYVEECVFSTHSPVKI